jgi:hypothetical protein
MRRFFGFLVVLLAVFCLGVVALAARKPDTFQVQRSATIKAPPEKIFPYLNSPKAAMAWIPFLEPDPNVKLSYAGPESGKGAAQSWSGNTQVGEGKIEIINSKPPTEVTLQLDMLKPLEGHNTVVYSLEPKGDVTNMTWVMSGHQPMIGKIVSVFIDCDRMVGEQFEKGLAKLKTVVEAPNP